MQEVALPNGTVIEFDDFVDPNTIRSVAQDHIARTNILGQFEIGGPIGIKDILGQLFKPTSLTKAEAMEIGQDITPLWGDVRAAERGIDLMNTPVNPLDYVVNGQLDQASYLQAERDRGAEIGLELGSVVPAIGGLGFGLAKLFGGNVPRRFRQSGMIAGPGAKTADLDALVTARAMKDEGSSADDIFQATGWWLDHPDGVPRFEIDDSEALLEGFQSKYGFEMDSGAWPDTVEDILAHDELYKNYPVGDTRLAQLNFGDMKGSYSTDDNAVTLFPSNLKGTKDAQSTALHELQHAIQSREGMARGGSPEMFSPVDIRQQELFKINQAIDARWNEIPDNLKDAARKINRGEDVDGSAMRKIQNNPDAKAAWANYIRAQQDYEEVAQSAALELSPFDQYKRLAGESEARLVQQRMGMTHEFRANYPFYRHDPTGQGLGYDVPLDEQILRFDDDVAQ